MGCKNYFDPPRIIRCEEGTGARLICGPNIVASKWLSGKNIRLLSDGYRFESHAENSDLRIANAYSTNLQDIGNRRT